MTDKQKLQQLFEAALKAPAPHNEGVAPQRAFPTPNLDFASAANPAPMPAFQPTPTPAFQPAPMEAAPVAPAAPIAPVIPVAPVAPVAAAPQAQTVFETVEEIPAPAPTLDKKEADKLGSMLDERIATKARRRKIELVITLILFFGSTGGTAVWFALSPARMQAMREVIRDFRQYGDINSMVAKYQEYLNKIGARNQQLDQASAMMGVDSTKVDHSDEAMDAEMKEMMGEEGGKTLGERNKAMQAAFGDRAEQAGEPLKANTTLKEEESFGWK